MNKKLKIIFAGTPQFAVPTLERISNVSFEIVCVLTQPDRKAGRGMKTIPSHVKNTANKLGLLIMQPQSLKNPEVFNAIKDLKADILVVAAYGLIIPEKILNLFDKGCFNVHASLLPRWRGAAPIHRAIENGDNQIGVTIMKVVSKLDAGPMIRKISEDLSTQSTTGEMTGLMALKGAELMLEVLEDIAKGNEITPTIQDETKVTYANKINKTEGKLNLDDSPDKLVRKIKAFNPYPGITYIFRRKIFKIWDAISIHLSSIKNYSPGDLISIDKKLILVLNHGALELFEVQLEGANKISGKEFIKRYSLDNGDT
ncbi:MAG: methionyl-tRNA formyltransferase [Methylophilaceae bacterium]|tara:strand:+ start:1651 stop:2592 length:942 start_codon:yes stop_codon:yes gene_type:complete